MKNYLKLHRLSFRKNVAGAANRMASEKLREFEADVRKLQNDLETLRKDNRYRDSERAAETAKIEAALERAIAVHDIAVEEKYKVEQAFSSASATYQSVRTYLEDNRNLIPEGIPNGI